jgi:hypothetical protein
LVLQASRIAYMTESAHNPWIKGLIILPCANHILNMVLRNSIEGIEELAIHIGLNKTCQGIMRKNAAIWQYGKLCPTFPETRWVYGYGYGVLN